MGWTGMRRLKSDRDSNWVPQEPPPTTMTLPPLMQTPLESTSRPPPRQTLVPAFSQVQPGHRINDICTTHSLSFPSSPTLYPPFPRFPIVITFNIYAHIRQLRPWHEIQGMRCVRANGACYPLCIHTCTFSQMNVKESLRKRATWSKADDEDEPKVKRKKKKEPKEKKSSDDDDVCFRPTTALSNGWWGSPHHRFCGRFNTGSGVLDHQALTKHWWAAFQGA